MIGFLGIEEDIEIKQGAYFSMDGYVTTFDGLPFDITDCVFSGVLKRKWNSAVVATFSFAIIDAASGKYRITLDQVTTGELEAGETVSDSKSKYIWELNMTEANGRLSPLAYGTAFVFRKLDN